MAHDLLLDSACNNKSLELSMLDSQEGAGHDLQFPCRHKMASPLCGQVVSPTTRIRRRAAAAVAGARSVVSKGRDGFVGLGRCFGDRAVYKQRGSFFTGERDGTKTVYS